MERSTDDITGFINNIIRSVFKLSSSNSNPLGLLIRQDGSLYKIIAAKEDHKKDIIALSVTHLKLWLRKKGKFNQL
jgi:hypothetical protein